MSEPRAPRRIVFLVTTLDVGGAEVQLVRLVLALDRARWTPQVVSLLPAGSQAAPLEAAGIPVTSLGMRRGRASLRALVRTVRLLRRERPEILACFMPHAALLGRIAARFAGVRIVTSSFRGERPGSPLVVQGLRWTRRWGTVATANCERVALTVAALGIVPPGGVRVMPNACAVQPPRAAPHATRAALGLRDGEFLWAAVGRLHPDKDYATLVAAFASVVRASGETRLVIAGDGHLADEIRDDVDRRGLAARVQLLGPRSDTSDLLAAADGFVLSSCTEGSPNALLEALSLGTPVVATEVGGVPEIVVDGRGGVLVPARNPEALAAAMRALMELPAGERRSLGQRGAAFVSSVHDPARVHAMWESLFEELAESRPAAPR